MPGRNFSLVSGPDAHADHVRFSWTVAPAGGRAVAGGTDLAQLGDDGRIKSVIGFLDPVG
jgi:hypothetical protein